LIFVFENKVQAELYIKNFIEKNKNSNFFLPKTISKNDFWESFSEKFLDEDLIVFIIYQIYFQNFENISFEDFFFISKKILEDFKFIDLSCLDICGLKDNFIEKNKINFERFSFIYFELEKVLEKEKINYKEKFLKKLNSNIDKYIDYISREVIFFYPINLSLVEENILRKFKKSGKNISFFYQNDSFFSDQDWNFSYDLFFKIKNDNFFNFENLNLISNQKKINFIERLEGNLYSQIDFVSNFIKKNNKKIAVISENQDYLSFLHFNLNQSNLYLDYDLSISNSKILEFVFLMIDFFLEKNEKRLKKHTLFKIINSKFFVSKKYSDLKINFENDFIEEKYLENNEFFQKILKNDNFFNFIFEILDQINSSLQKENNNEIEIKSFFFIKEELEFLKKIFQDSKSIDKIKNIFFEKIFKKKINIKNKNGNIFLTSLENLPIESFDYIFFLDFSENSYKNEKKVNNFFYENHLSNKSYQKEEEILSYKIYSKIFLGENIYFLYEEKLGPNRFLLQLKNKYRDFFQVENKLYNIFFKKSIDISIDKKDKDVEFFFENLKNKKISLSPSMINSFLDCQLQFYFRYIKKLKKNDFFEKNEERDFGILLHELLYQIYSRIKSNDFSYVKKKIEDEIINLNDTIYNFFDKNSKLNEIYQHLIKKNIENILKFDLDQKINKIIFLEKKITREIKLENLNFSLKISGKIDRVDEFDDFIKIIDYKTSTIKNKFSCIEDLFDQKINRNKEAFQIILYGFLYEKENFINKKIELHLYNIRQINKKESTSLFTKQEKNYEKYYYSNIFEDFLKKLLIEIFDIDEKFIQTQNKEKCKSCIYRDICRI
jgi:CRISPR/Cas system-associated exonuclease Cas4 (RecB family)